VDKIDRLIKEALESCVFRGHKMAGVRIYKNRMRASCTCLVCGKGVWIETDPLPNSIDIAGEAVALGCED